jgi:hypothetical protein
MTLMAEGFDQHISKGYIYSAMAFSVFVEVLNLRAKKPWSRLSCTSHTAKVDRKDRPDIRQLAARMVYSYSSPGAGIEFNAPLDESDGLGDRKREHKNDHHESPEFFHEKILRIELE